MKPLRAETTEEIAAIAREKGCRLLAIERSGVGRSSVLRIVLERENGSPVTIEQCEAVSREVSPVLDAADEISHAYALEVSSAGLDRKLYTVDDAQRFVGRRVRVKTDSPVVPESSDPSRDAPGSRNLRGTLESVEGDVLRVVDEENRKTYNVRFGDIRLARLEFEWPERHG
ncbi:MAG TPA: ribosome maturation factor RimP [Thermoanaerobaculia bacterium]|jgi:ribosome maturation factor RimP|nr:ribosome maturation factor RimP [Thermoanaerobaculia bacterium]